MNNLKVGDIARWKWTPGAAPLIVKKLLATNRMRVNFVEPRPAQGDWDVYRSDYEKIGNVDE